MSTPTVLFVCVHNAGRSQMAAGWLAHFAGGAVDVRSAGSAPADRLNPVAVQAMAEVGVDITRGVPTLLDYDTAQAADVIVTMGCGDTCPVFPGKSYRDWVLDDPAGQPIEVVRQIRDEIRVRVVELLAELRPGAQLGDVLQTRRLELCRPVAGDVDAILLVNGDPRAFEHNPSDALASRYDAEQLFERWNEHWDTYGFGYRVVRARGQQEVLGFCGLKVVSLDGRPVLNLFYRFAPSAWGRGIATEAATSVVEWAAVHRADWSVIARVLPANTGSQRVAVKVGLVRTPEWDSAGEDGVDWIYARQPG